MLKVGWYSAIALTCINALIMVLVIPLHIAYNILSAKQYFGLWVFLAGSMFLLLFYGFGLLIWIIFKNTDLKDLDEGNINN